MPRYKPEYDFFPMTNGKVSWAFRLEEILDDHRFFVENDLGDKIVVKEVKEFFMEHRLWESFKRELKEANDLGRHISTLVMNADIATLFKLTFL